MFGIIKRVSWFLNENKLKYITLISVLMFITFLQVLRPKIIGAIIDSVTLGTMTASLLYILGGALVVIPIFIYFLNNIYHVNMAYNGQRLSKELRLRYLSKMFDTDSKLYEKYSKGELISRLANDMQFITQAVTDIVTNVIFCFAMITFVLIIMIFTVSVKLTIVAFSIIPIMFIILTIWRQHMRKYYDIHRKIYDKFYQNTLETIEGQRVVRAYTQEDNDYEKNKIGINNDINSWLKIIRFEVMFGPLFDLTIAVATFLTFSYGTYLVIISEITPGQLVTFSIYITMVSGPIQVLANIYNLLNQAQVGADRYYEVIDTESEVTDTTDSKEIMEFNQIKFNNVSFKYPFDERNVINDITFEINKGETIGIVGKSGSGKSTLIRQLLREFNITEGNVTIDGKDISEYKIDDVRHLVGYVPQVHTLFKGSVEENLVIGKYDADHYLKKHAISIAAFDKDLSYMNDGLNTRVEESGGGLSGGQKQRLSIARALIIDPEILILDDSLSAVDANTEKKIINNINKHRIGKTNLIISHRFSVVKNADKIIVLREGEITEMGTHEQLMDNQGWYYRHYLEQIKGGSN